MDILPVNAQYVDQIWFEIKDMLKKAVDLDDGHSMDDVRRNVKSRNWQLWLAVDKDDKVHAVCVTLINVYPQKKTCLIMYLAGKNRDLWIHMLRDIEHWAGQNGCQDIELRGRRGWARVMTDFEQTDVICRKQIGD